MIRYSLIFTVLFSIFASGLSIAEIRAEATGTQTVEQVCPGFASGVLKGAKMVPMKKGILLLSEDIEIRESELKKAVKEADPEIREELGKNLFFILEQEAMKKVLLREAESHGFKKKDTSDAELLKEYLNHMADGARVPEEEVRAFYDENKQMVGGMPYDQAREIFQQFLLQQKKQDLIDAHIRDLGNKADLRVNMDWVKRQQVFAKDNPVDRARMSGKPTMVEFGATGCIPCDMMQPILDKLREKYPDKLNVVFVHVRENPILGARFGIRSIPVQVFFDKEGEEVFSHVGFLEESKVMKQLVKLGVE